MVWYIISFYIAINVYGLFIMFIDKRKAIKGKWRVSEKHLWTIAILGGAIGLTWGMEKFRHKTKHTHFKILLPTLAVVTLVIYIFFLSRLA